MDKKDLLKEMKKEEKILKTFYLEKKVFDEVNDLLKNTDLSFSGWINILLKENIDILKEVKSKKEDSKKT